VSDARDSRAERLDLRHKQRDTACVEQRLQVTVPSVVGLTVAAGDRVASDAEVVLAQVDADGPPLGEMLWPHQSDYVIASQTPVAGTLVRRWESVVITYVRTKKEGSGPAGLREPRRTGPTPGSLAAARPLDEAETTHNA